MYALDDRAGVDAFYDEACRRLAGVLPHAGKKNPRFLFEIIEQNEHAVGYDDNPSPQALTMSIME